MKSIKLYAILIGACAGVATSANAQTGANYNTALGNGAFGSNTHGYGDTALGFLALGSNTTGYSNTASGAFALKFNTTGVENTATGSGALEDNTTGGDNTATGNAALVYNTTGYYNVAIGSNALLENQTGSWNISIGTDAGYYTTGWNNIDIGNVGISGENGVIRIGTAGPHTAAFVAGISTSPVTGAVVYVTPSGQLGVAPSSERYKTAIMPMGTATAKLQELRPVTFHLKSDPDGAVQYGLIAEEVDKVYPELVIRDEKGEIQGVRYDELAPMLLNEMQQQKAQLEQQNTQLRDMQQLKSQLQDTQHQVEELKQLNQSMQAAILKVLA